MFDPGSIIHLRIWNLSDLLTSGWFARRARVVLNENSELEKISRTGWSAFKAGHWQHRSSWESCCKRVVCA
eukprot:5801158-Amphidinium_carterae.1